MALPLPGLDAAVSVTRHRYGAQTIGSDGRPVRAAESSTVIRAVVRDLDLSEIRALPEGWRETASVGVTTSEDLRTGDDTAGTWPDVVEVDGERHTVVKVGSGPPVGPLPRVYDAICIREPARGPRGWTP
jgi:hypothetical protein